MELTHESETCMIVIVVPCLDGNEGLYRVTTDGQSYMGSLRPEDRVVEVRKIEPTELGASLHHHT